MLSMLSFSLLYSSIFVDFASLSGRPVPAVMVFPVALSGAPVVVTVDCCRGCQQEDVPTVRATGKKGKPYCASCWDPHLKLLKPQERGDPSVAAQVPAEPKAPESKAPEPDFTRCKHPECYANWKKAKHYSGYCSLSCALASGWVEDSEDFARCKHPECHANWRKARHYSGHCSLSCALASGWVEDVTERPMKKAKRSSSGVAVPPPSSMSAEITQEIFAGQMMANKMVRCQMEQYIARTKGNDVEAVRAKNDKHGLGFTKKGLDFFNKDSKAGSIVFVSAGILQ